MNRYTIQFSERFEKLLTEAAEREQLTKAETIRRSVALYALIARELSKGDRTLKILDENSGQETIFLSNLFLSNERPASPKGKTKASKVRVSNGLARSPRAMAE